MLLMSFDKPQLSIRNILGKQVFFIFLREFQLMSFTPDNSFLLSNQDTNQFFV